MFEMFKKKNSGAAENVFQPSFGTADEFASRRPQKEYDILMINDDRESISKKCVIPYLMRGNLSYVVYDPRGVYSEAMSQAMKDKGYDVQVLDFEDEENKSRVDLFEIVNIARNPYWLSLMLSGSIKCAAEEILTAHNMFMAMMQYLLDTQQNVTIEDMKDLFVKIVEEDRQTKRDMERSPVSKQSISKVNSAPDEIKQSVFAKIEEGFFDRYYEKVAKPNIFTLPIHNKKTVLFVKQVPKKYKGLMTVMLFNLRVAGVFRRSGDLNAMIIDARDGEWYNKKLFAKVCDESGLKTDHGVVSMRIKKAIDQSVDLDDGSIVVYMHSNDVATKEYVFEALKVKNQMNEEELKEISEKHFRGKKLKEDVLNSAPITMEELEAIQDCIVIDPARKARPFRCDEWVV